MELPLRNEMGETEILKWQETVDMAVEALEKRTGLKLAGLTHAEINQQVREWMKAKADSKLAT